MGRAVMSNARTPWHSLREHKPSTRIRARVRTDRSTGDPEDERTDERNSRSRHKQSGKTPDAEAVVAGRSRVFQKTGSHSVAECESHQDPRTHVTHTRPGGFERARHERLLRRWWKPSGFGVRRRMPPHLGSPQRIFHQSLHLCSPTSCSFHRLALVTSRTVACTREPGLLARPINLRQLTQSQSHRPITAPLPPPPHLLHRLGVSPYRADGYAGGMSVVLHPL